MHPMYVAWNKVIPGAYYMVYTESAPRWQQFHMAPVMEQPNDAVSTPPQWIFKNVL